MALLMTSIQAEFYEECTEEFARKKFEDMENLYRWLAQKLDA